ncbi:LGFP repeat-containing protein [Gordonia phosphorivorans]|uniref:LGFP repeat-containing protein n=1 Tax=Gordonia phosphorivorans TaxID=1056982 RepID=A0ABV6H7A0_9ACTN
MNGVRGRISRPGIVLAVLALIVAMSATWSSVAAPAHADVRSEAQAAIDAYASDPARSARLGAPTGDVRTVRPGGAAQNFANGTVYYSPRSGAHAVLGAIAARYRAVGGPATIGFPTGDEQQAGSGRYSTFGEPGTAAIYWSPQTRASLVTGGVLRAWLASGGVDGPFGFPTSDTAYTGRADESSFAGPGGTLISWSSTSGLTTEPADLAAAQPLMAAAAATEEARIALSPADPATPATASWWQKWWPAVAGAAAVLLVLILLLAVLAWRRRRRGAAAAAGADTAEGASPTPSAAVPAALVGERPDRADAEPSAEPEPDAEPEPETEAEPEPEPEPEITLSDETALASALVVAYQDDADSALTVAYVNNALGTDRAGSSDDTHAWLHRADPLEDAPAEQDDTETTENAETTENSEPSDQQE